MKTFEIKISAFGTKNQIEIALLEFIRDLQFRELNEMEGTTEDPVFRAEIIEQ